MSDVISDDRAKRNIAANVRRLLQDRQWTQAELATKTQEKQATISRIVNGLHVPGAGVVARIAEAFDVSADRLLAEPPTEILAEI
jgi:transcriptional regulator with XRE-family HTH domain